MSGFRDILANARSQIREIGPAEAARRLGEATFVDVREPDEYAQGAIPGAVHIPRGNLELAIEGRVQDKGRPLVVYCAGGVRSALATKTLQEMGYKDVVSMDGGFNKWKDGGFQWAVPATLSLDQRNRYHRHLLLPEVGEEGQKKLLESKVLLLGAGGLGSPAASDVYKRQLCTWLPPVSALLVWSTWTWSMRLICSARSSTTSIELAT